MAVDTQAGASQTSASAFMPPGGRQVDRNRIRYDGAPVLSLEQIIQILLMVGFPRDKVVAFATVAYRESANGGTWIVGGPTGGYSNEYSFGIFGLNTLGAMWEEQKKMVPGLTSRAQLLDPVMNARLALAMFKKYGDRPWRTLNGTWNPNGQMLNNLSTYRAQVAYDRLVQTGQLVRSSAQIYSGLTYFNRFGAGTYAGIGGQGGGGEPPPMDSGLGTGTGGAGAGYPEDPGYMAGTPSSGTPVVNPANPQEVEAYIRQNYGYMVGFMNHPELGPILRQAAIEGLSKEMLYGRISGTQWWKTTSDSTRKWQALRSEDPATADAEVAKRRQSVSDLAAKKGWDLTPEDLAWLSEHSLAAGWTEGQILDYLVTYNAATLGAQGGMFVKGELGSMVNKLRAEARRWMVPLNDAELNEYSKQIAIDENTFEGLQAVLAQRAKQRFGANQVLVDAIARGIAPGDLLGPQVSRIAQTLEMSPDAIDLNSERWAPVYQKASTKGQTVMNLDETAKFARQQDEYIATTGARRSLLGVDAMIRQAFGY